MRTPSGTIPEILEGPEPLPEVTRDCAATKRPRSAALALTQDWDTVGLRRSFKLS